MYVETLQLRDLRCFRDPPVIEFLHPDMDPKTPDILPNVNLLLGDNGVGKTTILKALALGAIAPVVQSSGYVPYRLIRSAPNGAASKAEIRARMRLHSQDVASPGTTQILELSTVISRRGDYELMTPQIKDLDLFDRMFDDHSPAVLVVGYGATRRVEAADRAEGPANLNKQRTLRYRRVAGLFEDHIALTPLGVWLPELKSENKGRFSQVCWLLNELLDGRASFTGDLEGDEYVFEHRGARVPFPALSDGYRAYIGWIADLLYHVCMGCPPGATLSENSGLVIVDEIDLHLHPSWQRTVIPKLSRTLPRLQFVFSTHSPLVAGTLHAENIVVMDVADDGATIPRRSRERIHGLNADQVLLSSYFGLTSTRAPDAKIELVELSRQARAGNKDAALEFMKRLTANGVTTGAPSEPRRGARRSVKSGGKPAKATAKQGKVQR